MQPSPSCPATILAGGKCVIENLPNISDVATSVEILHAMGASIRMIDSSTLEVDTSRIVVTDVPAEMSRADARLLLFSRRAAGALRPRLRLDARRLRSGHPGPSTST